jgi:minor histocompatibility antigen H13
METDMNNTGLFIAYGAVLSMAVVPIFAGSVASIRGMKRPENAPKRQKIDSPLEDSDDEDEGESESLSTSDAYMFPVIGSGVLLSMYLVFRYLDKKYVDYMITTYFSVMGCAAVTKAFMMLTRKVVPVGLIKNVSKYKVTLTKRGKSKLDYRERSWVIDEMICF